MSKIKKSVNKVFKFFDKKVIVPITKIFVKISEMWNSNSKNFERFLSRKSSLIIISLILSVFIFVYVDEKSTIISETSAEVIYNQQVKAIYNEEAYAIEGLPETVDITMIGRKSDLYLAKQLPIDAVDVDLKDLKEGTHKVSLKYKGAINAINYKIDPSVATVIIYPKVSEVRTVSIDILNQDKLNSKLTISNVEIDRQEIIIKGAQYKLDKVASVKALVDINNVSNPEVGTITLSNVPLIAYDEKGVVIDIEIVPSTVTATLTITSPKKTVPVKIVPTGELSFGKAISRITSSVDSIDLYGDEEVLSTINNIEVFVDVTGLSQDKKYTATIKKPSGVRSISENTTSVSIEVDSESTKEFDDIQIEYKNLNSKYSINASSNDDKYATVIVKGVESVLEKFDSSSIIVYVDLEKYEPGIHEVTVNVDCNDARLVCTSKVKTVSLVISEKKG